MSSLKMLKIFVIGIGGFLGAISRYGISQLNVYWGLFPLGTFLANGLGCLLMGFLVQLLATYSHIPKELHFLLIAGFLGSMTTLSTFSHETFQMLELRQLGYAAMYLFFTVLIGLGAVFTGKKLAIWLVS